MLPVDIVLGQCCNRLGGGGSVPRLHRRTVVYLAILATPCTDLFPAMAPVRDCTYHSAVQIIDKSRLTYVEAIEQGRIKLLARILLTPEKLPLTWRSVFHLGTGDFAGSRPVARYLSEEQC